MAWQQRRTVTVEQPCCHAVLMNRYATSSHEGLDRVRSRVARALACAEPEPRRHAAAKAFAWALHNGFIPAGRIQRGAGVDGGLTLLNCFVQPVGESPADSVSAPGFYRACAEAMATLRSGGGVGYDFSDVAPRERGSPRARPGPLPVLSWYNRCAAALADPRGAAQMGVLHVSHPDIEAFVQAKLRPGALRHFNLSVGISDAFMEAVASGLDFNLVHRTPPAHAASRYQDGHWVYRRLPARELWRGITSAALRCGEPGLLFIDRINRENNLAYCETIEATNPCGEQPLPAYGCCCLGSLDLTVFVARPFTAAAEFDHTQFKRVASLAVRMLDNALELTPWPLPAQREQGLSKRRIGLGITGLADALIMLGLRYNCERARQWAAEVMSTLRDTAYAASIELARERGPFPTFHAGRYLRAPFVARLPVWLRERLWHFGIRNSHLLAIAPAGSISLAFGDNCSAGVEPVFDWRYRRLYGSIGSLPVEDSAYHRYRLTGGDINRLPAAFMTSAEIEPIDQLRMVAALAPYVDAGIAKTVRLAEDCGPSVCEDIYWQAWRLGLKGITVFRPNAITGAALACVAR